MTHNALGRWDDQLAAVFVRHSDQRIFKVVGVIDRPAVILEDVISGHQSTHVIGSPNLTDAFAELRRDGGIQATQPRGETQMEANDQSVSS